tara:strand:+ start:469 stop:1113 length:645 start_codon:yes stop_codon:yes gene_type:complete
MHINHTTIQDMESHYRVNFVNSLSGFKSVNIIATANNQQFNAALFSSVVHIGSNPALLGMISRPNSVPRHTLENINASGHYTINQVHSKIYKQAHHTSARSKRDESEFSFSKLTPEFLDHFPIPFVQQSSLKIGLIMKEIIPIKSNNTLLIVGQVDTVIMPKQALTKCGTIDHEQLDSVCISGLNRYYSTEFLGQLGYAKKQSVPVFELRSSNE